MRSARPLEALVRLATGALAAGALSCNVAAATGGTRRAPDAPREPAIDPATFSLNVCDGRIYNPVAGLVVAPPVDYVAIDSVRSRAAARLPVTGIVTDEGTPCESARQRAACSEALENLTVPGGWREDAQSSILNHLVYTRGDTVAAVTSFEELTAFLVPVASAKSAALLATVRGHRFECRASNARPVAEGFELITQTNETCDGWMDQHVVRVARDGTFMILKTARAPNRGPHCVYSQ